MEDVTDLVLHFGGPLSGEHGDGLVRSERNRKMFGPVVTKIPADQAFDPHNLLNPGKVVDAPAMEENLPFGYHTRPIETIFDYSNRRVLSIDRASNGAGFAKTHGGAMKSFPPLR
jgi:hypothetical protein